MDYGRNLLFGILAVQLRKIAPGKMAEIAAAASADPGTDIPVRLLDEKLISPADHDLLQSLVEEAIREHGGNANAAIDWLRGTEAIYETLRNATQSHTETDYGDGAELISDEEYLESLRNMRERPGRYWLKSEHARGGQGRLLLVHDETLGRDIILKELLALSSGESVQPTPVRRTASLVARFLQEAKVTSQLEHPTIVPVYEVGLRPDGTPYYTMKLLRGSTLSAALRACKDLTDRLAVLRSFADVCHGVAYAHSRNVIHRDLKPGNVMIGQFGETVILDWGLAKVLNKPDVQFDAFEKTVTEIKVGFDAAEGKTAPGAVLGTPAYMSPEQARGALQQVDKRSDVYGLGMILYELIAGRLPYDPAPVSSIIYRVAHEKPRSCLEFEPEAPPELVAICNRCLEQDPGKRYQDAAELSQDIDRFLSGALVAAYSYKIGDVLRRYYRRNRAIVNTVAAALMALAGLGIFSYVNISIARDREAAAHAVAEDETYVTQMHLAQSYMRQNNYKLARETLWATNPGLRNWEWGYLLNLCYLEKYTLDDCTTAAYSPGGTRFATTSRNKPIEIWNAENGSKIGELGGDSRGSLFAKYSADGSRILNARLSGTIYVWDAPSGKLLAHMKAHANEIVSAAFSDRADKVVTSGADGSVKIWDAANGQQLNIRQFPGVVIGPASFSRDDRFVVYVSTDAQCTSAPPPQACKVNLWNPADDRIVLSVQGSRYALGRDNTVLAVADGEDVVLVDVATGTPTSRLTGQSSFIRDMAVSPDGSTIYSGSENGQILAYDVASGAVRLSLEHGSAIRFLDLTADGKRLLSAGRDCTFRIWDTDSGSMLNSLFGHTLPQLFSAQLSPDGRYIASGSIDQTVKVWNTESSPGNRVVANFDSPIRAAAVSPDGTLAAVALFDQTLQVRRITDGALLASMACYSSAKNPTLAFSPDNRRVAASLDEFMPLVWDIESRRMICNFSGHEGPVTCLAFSPDGKCVASGSWDNTVRVWDAESGRQKQVLDGHTDTVSDVEYSPDGRWIATISEDGSAILWDSVGGAPIRRMELGGRGYDIAFSRDGTLIATCDSTHIARVWSIKHGEEISGIATAGAAGTRLAFSPDASRLLAISRRQGRMWVTKTGDEILSLADRKLLDAVNFGGAEPSLLELSADDRALLIRTPLAWNGSALAGAASASDREIVSRLRSRIATVSPAPAIPVNVTVATTREFAANAMTRLADGIKAAAGSEKIIVEGPIYNALARLCARRGDDLITVNGVSVTSGEIIPELGKLPQALHGATPSRLELSFLRAGRPITYTFSFVEPLARNVKKDVAQSTLRDYFKSFRADESIWSSATRESQKRLADDIGEPAGEGDAINGVWIGDSRTTSTKPQLLSCGLARSDRLISLGGQKLLAYATLTSLTDAFLAADKSSMPSSLRFEVDRGQFQHLDIVVTIH